FSPNPRALVPRAGASSTMSLSSSLIAAARSCRLFAAASACASSNIRALFMSVSCASPTAICRLVSTYCPGANLGDEPGERLAKLIGRLLLQEVEALDRYGLLIRPGPAEFPRPANQKAAGVRVDEEFRDRAGREPLRVVLDDRGHVCRFA